MIINVLKCLCDIYKRLNSRVKLAVYGREFQLFGRSSDIQKSQISTLFRRYSWPVKLISHVREKVLGTA